VRCQPGNLAVSVESQPDHGGSTSSRRSGLPRLNQASSSQARKAPPQSKQPPKKTEGKEDLEQPLEPPEPLDLFVPMPPAIIETKHAWRRKATATAWAELLPKLVYPLMEWLCHEGGEQSKSPWSCSCPKWEKEVKVVSFTSAFHHSISHLYLMELASAISKVKITYCQHQPPAVSLVKLGAFSSTPIRPPAWAFDIMLLEYMSKQFAYGTPDISAWCNATTSFLSSRGVEKVPTPVRHFHSSDSFL
jgi:hypothetical protein